MRNAVADVTKGSGTMSFWLRNLVAGRPHRADFIGQMPAPKGRDPVTRSSALLDCYLEGWAEANPLKIIRATAPDYEFYDPVIGSFGRTSVSRYFQVLRQKFAVAGVTKQSEVAFSLRGPMHAQPGRPGYAFYREAAAIGLTGIATITVGERGVTGETVAYDSNLALEILTRSLPIPDSTSEPATCAAPEIAA
jgi:hypothetical protein